MPVVAYAFHEHVAIDKLNEYYLASLSAPYETRTVGCRRCALAFAVLLVDRYDKRNAIHIESLRRLIEQDCIGGLHRDEYKLDVELVS